MLSHAILSLTLAVPAASPAPPSLRPQDAGEARAADADGGALLDAPELAAPEDLAERARALADAHATVELLPLFGELRSRAGRGLHALRVAGPDAEGNPALLVVANPDGPLTFASAMVLDHVETLAGRYAAGDEATRALLDRTTLYVVPCANPDAAAARFDSPLLERLSTGAGVDNDRDGRSGEDGPDDLDGDGRILTMIVAESGGTHVADPDHASLIRPAVAAEGEVGMFTVWPEGLDDDGDERVAEDGPLDGQVNANFAHGWREHSPEAGRYPSDEPAARALAEFVMAHDDIALVLTYGLLDNLVESPKGAAKKPGQRIPPDAVLEGDAGYLAELGKRYRELVEHEAKGRGKRGGTFQEWAYHHRGLTSLEVVPWDIPLDAKTPAGQGPRGAAESKSDGGAESKSDGEAENNPEGEAESDPDGEAEQGTGSEADPEEARQSPAGPEGKAAGKAGKPGKVSDDVKRLRWVEGRGEAEAWRYATWAPFDHPQLGSVSIGGWAPYARLEPPADHAAQVSTDQLAFLVSLGEVLPRIELEQAELRTLGGGLAEIEVAVTNPALIPVRGSKALDTRTIDAPRVELVLPEGAELLAGKRIELVRGGDLSAGGRAEYRWLAGGLSAGSTLELRLVSDHAGSRSITLEVR